MNPENRLPWDCNYYQEEGTHLKKHYIIEINEEELQRAAALFHFEARI